MDVNVFFFMPVQILIVCIMQFDTFQNTFLTRVHAHV